MRLMRRKHMFLMHSLACLCFACIFHCSYPLSNASRDIILAFCTRPSCSEQAQQVIISLLSSLTTSSTAIQLILHRRRLSTIEIHPREPVHEILAATRPITRRSSRSISEHTHQIVHTTTRRRRTRHCRRCHSLRRA